MNTVILHTEYLLRHHECVVLPGWGAFISRRLPARFDPQNADMMLPPCRKLTFNTDLKETDGLVASSISRRDGINYAEADKLVATEVSAALAQLESEGELLFGHLGAFMKLPGTPMRFYPAMRSVNSMYYGLSPLRLRAIRREREQFENPAELPPIPVARAAAQNDVEEYEDVAKRGWVKHWSRNVAAVAALLAVVVTVGLFVMNPIRMTNEPNQASIAPTITRIDPVPVPTQQVQATPNDQISVSESAPLSVSEASQVAVMKDEKTVPAESSVSKEVKTSLAAKPQAPAVRFQDTDPFVVVVASFPGEEQARQYKRDHSSTLLDILEQDGKYRVYCTTARTYQEARQLKDAAGVADAWVCVR